MNSTNSRGVDLPQMSLNRQVRQNLGPSPCALCASEKSVRGLEIKSVLLILEMLSAGLVGTTLDFNRRAILAMDVRRVGNDQTPNVSSTQHHRQLSTVQSITLALRRKRAILLNRQHVQHDLG